MRYNMLALQPPLPRLSPQPSLSLPSPVTHRHCSPRVIVCAPSNASPGSTVCHPTTAPGSTHTMCLNPSLGAKSAMPAAFSTHGFHTTTLLRLSRVTV